MRIRWWSTLALVVMACTGTPEEELPPPSDEIPDPVCADGFADCNGDPGDGCETDLSSPSSCGACDNVCEAPGGGVASCEAAQCSFTCRPGAIECGGECTSPCPFLFDAPGQYPFVVPGGCGQIRVVAWGAGGGNGERNTDAGAGGHGAAAFDVTAGDSLTIVVGAPGGSAVGNQPGLGGLPGGGEGGSSGGSQAGGGGGGFSGVFAGSVDAATALLIAGGGGGSGGGTGRFVIAGGGGGENGEKAPDNDGGGAGGTQDSGFEQLAGGPGADRGGGDGGGGGGSGWFGGRGGSGADTDAKGGGGGSGFLAAVAIDPVLEAAAQQIPGGATVAERGTAGDPEQPGKVAFECLP